MVNFGTRLIKQTTIKKIMLTSDDLLKLEQDNGQADHYIVLNQKYVVGTSNEPTPMPVLLKQVEDILDKHNFNKKIEITDTIPKAETYQKYRNKSEN